MRQGTSDLRHERLTAMLQVKFFSVNERYYVKTRHNGVVTDTTPIANIYMDTAAYIRNVMAWGYARNEITFIIDPTITEDGAAESILNDIEIYANA